MARTPVIVRNRNPNSCVLATKRSPHKTPREARYRAHVARQDEEERVQRLREAYHPYNPSPQERERLREVRRQKDRQDHRYDCETLQRTKDQYQEAMFRFWNWISRLAMEEFDAFSVNEILPPYFRSIVDYQRLERNGVNLPSRTRVLEGEMNRAERVSWLLTHPQEIYRFRHSDSFQETARYYRELIIPRTNVIENYFGRFQHYPPAGDDEESNKSGFSIEEDW